MKKLLAMAAAIAIATLALAGCGPSRVGDDISPEKCEDLYDRFTNAQGNTDTYSAAMSYGGATPPKPPIFTNQAQGRSISQSQINKALEMLKTAPHAPQSLGVWDGPDSGGWYTQTLTDTEGYWVIRVRYFADEYRAEYDVTCTVGDGEDEVVVAWSGYFIFADDTCAIPTEGSMSFRVTVTEGESGMSIVFGFRFRFEGLTMVPLIDPEFMEAHGIEFIMTGTVNYDFTLMVPFIANYNNYNYASFTSEVPPGERQVLNITGWYDVDLNLTPEKADLTVTGWPLYID
ncbi:MAG: hypothetical protein ACM3X6_05770 [Patescibacteria group bacterium]